MTKPKIKIDIVSDVVCPWCYIGKRRLEKAVERVRDQYDFELEYVPFELNPHINKEGVNQKEYLSDKFGGDERYEQITDHTTSVAAAEGLIFNFASQKISPNTRNLHVVIDLAKEEGIQLPVVEAFFKAYFTKGVDLSKQENIIATAVSAGLEGEKVKQRLTNNNAPVKIELIEKEVQKLGITGVPFYILNNKYGVSGAQNTDTFIKVFSELATSSATEAGTEGEACDVESKNC
jgi:predicted DsbA family dithiol-disulfide isomerase